MSREASAQPRKSEGREHGTTAALLTVLLLAFAIGGPALSVPVITELPSEPFLLIPPRRRWPPCVATPSQPGGVAAEREAAASWVVGTRVDAMPHP